MENNTGSQAPEGTLRPTLSLPVQEEDAIPALKGVYDRLGWTMFAEPRPPTREELREASKNPGITLHFRASFLKNGTIVFDSPYSCGTDHVEHWFWEQSLASKHDMIRPAGCGPQPPHRRNFITGPRQTIFERDVAQAAMNRFRPAWLDVFSALATHCNSIAPYISIRSAFPEWASDMGLSEDSRSAHRTYTALVDAYHNLQDLIGEPDFAIFTKAGGLL